MGLLDFRSAGSIVLRPDATVAPVGSQQAVTAVVTDAGGEPRPHVTVNFRVDSGPNKRLTGQAVTDASGRADFTYVSPQVQLGTDTDVIRAFIQNKATPIANSNLATIRWLPQVALALSPTTATVPAGTAHNVTGQATDGAGHTVANLAITFRVTAGPNAGRTLQARTGTDGRALFAWTSNAPGTDTVEASILLSGGAEQASNPVSVTWTARPQAGTGPKLLLDPASSVHSTGETATVTATLLDGGQHPVAGAPVAFEITSGPHTGRTGQGTTDAQGRTTFAWVGTTPGLDTLRATAQLSGGTSVSGLAVAEWEALATTLVYTGPGVGEYSDAMVLTARLTESATGQPLAGQTVRYAFGARIFTTTTDAAGTAEVHLTVEETPGAVSLNVAFEGGSGWAASSATLLAVVTPEDTRLTATGAPALASGAQQPVSARLLDDDGTPVVGKTITFRLGTVTATALTGPDGTATATITLPATATTGSTRLQISFVGDTFYRPAVTSVAVLVAQPSSFVIWGGNTPGQRLGDRVQFWGAQWSHQVTGGDYTAQGDFKGWSKAALLPAHLCQPTAHTTGNPRLDASCWTSKPGNSGPPATVADYIQVIVTTSVAKNGSTIYGNIAATVVLQVDRSVPYGPNPGHPGFGTIAAVIEDGAHVFDPLSLALNQEAPSLSAAPAAAGPRRFSFYSSEMSLLSETELTTAPRPTILYDYIWFDGHPVAQVDSAGMTVWTFTDHLGTPLLQTSALQGVTWRAEYEPYGLVYSLRTYDRHQPLRFPGQEAEQLGVEAGANGVTERSYNIHRWYGAGVGRYMTPDPLTVSRAFDAYGYSGQRPLNLVDPLGLQAQRAVGPGRPDENKCCSEAFRLGLFDVAGAGGVVVCCNGNKVPCAIEYSGGISEAGILALKILTQCTLGHEKSHIDDLPECAPRCGGPVALATFAEAFSRNFSECIGADIEISCIEKSKSACGGNPVCLTLLDKRKSQAIDLKRTFGCSFP